MKAAPPTGDMGTRQHAACGAAYPVMSGLVIPALVSHRQLVKGLTVRLPFRHISAHQLREPLVVSRFKQVRHLVNDLRSFIFLASPRGHALTSWPEGQAKPNQKHGAQ